MHEDRQRKARDKFALGELVMKAGLRHTDRAFLLGALLKIATISQNGAEYVRLKAQGAAAFGIKDIASDRAPMGGRDVRD